MLRALLVVIAAVLAAFIAIAVVAILPDEELPPPLERVSQQPRPALASKPTVNSKRSEPTPKTEIVSDPLESDSAFSKESLNQTQASSTQLVRKVAHKSALPPTTHRQSEPGQQAITDMNCDEINEMLQANNGRLPADFDEGETQSEAAELNRILAKCQAEAEAEREAERQDEFDRLSAVDQQADASMSCGQADALRQAREYRLNAGLDLGESEAEAVRLDRVLARCNAKAKAAADARNDRLRETAAYQPGVTREETSSGDETEAEDSPPVRLELVQLNVALTLFWECSAYISAFTPVIEQKLCFDAGEHAHDLLLTVTDDAITWGLVEDRLDTLGWMGFFGPNFEPVGA